MPSRTPAALVTVVAFSFMAKTPLIMVEFDVPLDEMDDDQIDTLAEEIADAMAANLASLTSKPPTD